MKQHPAINIVLLAAAWAALGGGCADEAVQEPIVRPVRFVTVQAVQGDRKVHYTGTSRAGVEAQLSFKVSGNLRTVQVEVGDRVSEGDLIAALDPSDYELQVKQAEAARGSAEAALRKHASDYERLRGLYENNNVAKSDLDGARAAAEAARAQYLSAQKQVELARNQLSYTRLLAPQEGAIASVRVEVNENIQAGMPIAVLSNGAQQKISVSVPENTITKLRVGDGVEVRFNAISDAKFSGAVSEVGVAVNPAGAAFPVTVRLVETDARILSGMAAEVAFTVRADDDRPRYHVPASSVSADREGRFVYLVDTDGEGLGLVRRQGVETGELTADGLEIFAGLSDGDRVVTAGVSQIRDGLTVRLPQG